MSSIAQLVQAIAGTASAQAHELELILDKVEKELSCLCESQVQVADSVSDAMLRAGGKRLRPLLVVASYRAAGGNAEGETRAIRLGACFEMIHMATLLHDDVIDDASTRRGQPTAFALFGPTAAVLSGDVLLAKAMRVLAEDGEIEIIRSASQAVVDLAEGEVLELQSRSIPDLDLKTYDEIIEKKTASLIECCCRVGAMAAKAEQPVVDALGGFGYHVGRAFQYVDDLLDYRGQEDDLGKVPGTDFAEGAATYPWIMLLQSTSPKQVRRLLHGFGGSEAKRVRLTRSNMERAGVFAIVEAKAREELAIAQKHLEALPESADRHTLHSVADFVVTRDL